jgi:CBS domain containing-hemolysin-like protein
MSGDFWDIGTIIALVAANGFFVAAEFALVSVRKTRIEQLDSEGNSNARIIRGALKQLDRYIAGTQVGITLASLSLGWVGEPAIASFLIPFLEKMETGLPLPVIHTITVGIAFTLITFLHVIFGELIPKSLALQKPETTSLMVARPLVAAVTLFQPLIWSLNGLGNIILNLIGLKATGHEGVHSAKELELLVKESHKAGVLDDLEKRILQKTFKFSGTCVSEVMVPRSKMITLDLKLSLDQIIHKATEARYSRLPTYQETVDQVDGIIYIHDLFRISQDTNMSLTDIIHTPLFVPKTLHLDDMLEKFQADSTQIAIVVDEYGGTAGLITLEDIMASILGKIYDKNDDSIPEKLSSKDGIITAPGETRLVELEEAFGWSFENTEDIDTIGGYVMHRLERVPRVGDEVFDTKVKFKVSKMDFYRVVQVIITEL